MKKKLASPLEKLTQIVERGLAAVADDMSKLATKEDIFRVEGRLVSIEQELKDIKRRLAALEDAFEKTGYQDKQEIEALWKRVALIEKRLKMQRA